MRSAAQASAADPTARGRVAAPPMTVIALMANTVEAYTRNMAHQRKGLAAPLKLGEICNRMVCVNFIMLVE